MAESDRARLRVLFATPECHPLVKTGGLGDVAAALPAALAVLGVDVRLLLPGYPAVMRGLDRLRRIATLPAYAALPEAGILAGFMAVTNVPVYVLECPALYDRAGGPYGDARGADWPDNHLRFGLLSRAAAEIGRGAALTDWQADVVNTHDWQAGLAPLYLRLAGMGRPRSVMTIHNLAYQGLFPPTVMSGLGLPMDTFAMHGAEYYGNLSFLKAGLYYADRLSTVSPTYAREIQREPLGFGMHGLLAGRAAHLQGILNGIDTAAWDPRTDPYLARPYGLDNLSAKRDSKVALLQAAGLPMRPDRLLLGVVSRLTPQKGLDLVLEIVPQLADIPAALVVQGTGDTALEEAFREAAQRWPDTLAVRIGYDEGFAHRIEAGADAFLMPSRFEPCGLNQMYSQRYGTPPIVHATGGLADSVADANRTTIADGSGTGFLCRELTAAALLDAVQQAEATRRDPAVWRRLQRNGMKRDFSWAHSAREYLALFRAAVA